MRRFWAAALVTVALLWAGMVLGVAFLAVPTQFAAEGLSRPVGIDVARHVFARFATVQLGLAALTVLLAALLRPRRLLWILLAVVWLIVAAQSFWLLPVLEARADLLLRGQEPAQGPWHALYAGAEVAKLAALLLIAWRTARRRQ